jgi:hypothetical protein
VSQGRANAAKLTNPLRKGACRRQGVGSFCDDMTKETDKVLSEDQKRMEVE